MPVSEVPVLTGRMIAVVLFLVFLVGGASALATVAVLSGQESPEATPPPAVEPAAPSIELSEARAGGDDADAQEAAETAPAVESGDAEPPMADEEPPTEVGPTAALPAEASPTEPADVLSADAEPAADEGTIVMEGDAPTEQGQEVVVDDDDVVEDAGAPEPTPSEPSPSANKPSRREFETAECAKVRGTAEAEYKVRHWGKVLDLVRKRACWSSAQQVLRTRMQVRSLAELKRFGECIKAGRRSKDPETQGVVASCEKQVKG